MWYSIYAVILPRRSQFVKRGGIILHLVNIFRSVFCDKFFKLLLQALKGFVAYVVFDLAGIGIRRLTPIAISMRAIIS